MVPMVSVIVDDEVPIRWNALQAGGIFAVQDALVQIDGVDTVNPVACFGEFHGGWAVEEQVHLGIPVGVPQAFGGLERLDRVAQRVAVDPVEEDPRR